MKYSFFSIKTQFENLGDLLINRELVRLASDNSEVFVDTSRCPSFFSSELVSDLQNVRYGKYGFAKLILIMLSKRLRGNECYYFLSPGGYFGELNNSAYFKKKIISYFLFLMNLLKIKVVHFGVSYERLGERHKKIINQRSATIHKHIVRDTKSYNLMKNLGIKVDCISPDLAFNLFDLDIRSQAEQPVEKLFISFRCDQYDEQYLEVEDLVFHLHDCFEQNIEFVFYSQVGRDDIYMKKIKDKFSSKFIRKSSFVSNHISISKALSYFNHKSIVISNRLHVLLLSASAGASICPVVDEIHNVKVVSLFKDLGLTDESFIKLNQSKLLEPPCCKDILSSGSSQRLNLKKAFSGIYEK